ncbi:putative RNA-directed DNA polymerase, eukaryota, reverse transcriptase zinc-binding domain protein [Tanacetum coccineum]
MIRWIMACVTSASYSISINGNIHGYFKGKRGLRQGDPLSPYLFTLVMEILTLILQRRVRLSDSFRYHKHCEELGIINVCFADDLFIFARVEVDSAKVIMDSLNEFKRVSGLNPSIPKSTAFFCNVLNHGLLRFLLRWPSIGSGDWKNKFCLSGIFNNGEYKRGKAKVAWNVICLPKREGGLGLRSLKVFNLALMTTHIWNIVSNKESLWSWRKLLQLTEFVRPFFRSCIGNGMKTSLLYDSWCSHCPFSRFLSPRDITREGYFIQTCVADWVINGAWNWPQAWLLKAPNLGLIPALILDPSRQDSVKWCDDNGNMMNFSVKCAWEVLRPRGNEVAWFHTVVPKNDLGQLRIALAFTFKGQEIDTAEFAVDPSGFNATWLEAPIIKKT